MTLTHRVGLLLCGIAALVAAPRAFADEPSITVSTTGEATIKPNRLEINVRIGANAELTGDAVIKYRDAVRRTKEQLEKVKIDNLQWDDQGASFSSGGGTPARGEQNQTALRPDVGIAKSLRLSILGIDKLAEEELLSLIAKVLDVAKDSGAALSDDSTNAMMARFFDQATRNQIVTFVVDDITPARQQAAALAFKQAEAEARHLAELAGARLGAARSVEETIAKTQKEPSPQEKVLAMIYRAEVPSGGSLSRFESPNMGAVTIRVDLRVRFAIQAEGKTQ